MNILVEPDDVIGDGFVVFIISDILDDEDAIETGKDCALEFDLLSSVL